MSAEVRLKNKHRAWVAPRRRFQKECSRGAGAEQALSAAAALKPLSAQREPIDLLSISRHLTNSHTIRPEIQHRERVSIVTDLQ